MAATSAIAFASDFVPLRKKATVLGRARKILIPRGHVPRARHLGEIEFAAAQEPPVPRGGSHIGEDRELDAFGTDDAFLQGTHDLVIATGEGEPESAHHLSLSLGS